MEVKLVIEGTEIELLPRGPDQGFERFVAPKVSGIKATVWVKAGWKRKSRIIVSRVTDDQ